MTAREIRFNPAPPSTSIFVTLRLQIVGETNNEKHPILQSREDHPPRVEKPGQLALVVAPQVGGYKFTKVLMDRGSSINILYYDTFHCMSLTDKDLKPSNTVFHGVVPSKSAYPVGKIALEVAFGDA